MSYARGFGLNGKSIYMNIAQPKEVELNFTVDVSNGNGLGVRSIKSNGYVDNVFMHTTATPGTGLSGKVNPNPLAGYALIIFKNNFNYALSGSSSFVSPPSGSGLTSVTAGHVYQIATLGTTTAAQWLAAGVPAGFTPSLNQSFVATSTGSIGGSGTVFVPGTSGISLIETVGDPNQSISNSSIASNSGAQVIIQFLAPTSSSTTTLIPTQPAQNTVVALRFRFDGSSVSIPDGGPSNSAGAGGL